MKRSPIVFLVVNLILSACAPASTLAPTPTPTPIAALTPTKTPEPTSTPSTPTSTATPTATSGSLYTEVATPTPFLTLEELTKTHPASWEWKKDENNNWVLYNKDLGLAFPTMSKTEMEKMRIRAGSEYLPVSPGLFYEDFNEVDYIKIIGFFIGARTEEVVLNSSVDQETALFTIFHFFVPREKGKDGVIVEVTNYDSLSFGLGFAEPCRGTIEQGCAKPIAPQQSLQYMKPGDLVILECPFLDQELEFVKGKVDPTIERIRILLKYAEGHREAAAEALRKFNSGAVTVLQAGVVFTMNCITCQ
jgi:hypothetical protein